MSELLLEVGCEELPASFVDKAVADLKDLLVKGLDELGIRTSDPITYSTPRRLIVSFPTLALRQEDSEKDQRGPSVKAAFDAEGNPTQALLGFCRGQGIEVSALRNDGQYVWFTKKLIGRPTTELLAELLPKAITSLSFEKSMRWGASRLRFARPIRWILACFNSQPVTFDIEGVAASNLSRGHRFYSPAPFVATGLEQLISELRSRSVEPDVAVRRKLIVDGSKAVADGTPQLSDGLIDENSQLTEWPTQIAGNFPAAYLALPEAVLVTTMAKHEKMFPVRDSSGKLTNQFVFTRNSGVDADVRRGCEWVLNARMNDAKFFYEQDAKWSLDDFLAKTSEILFQAQLGTVRRRADRLSNLAAEIAKMTGASSEEIEFARQAGLYAKADLGTGLVSELSSLQGVIGGEYARRDGKSEAVAFAIGAHYDPTQCSPETASGRTAARVLLADQLDKLAGYLGLGLEPTGSSDPFGLRRAVTFLIETAWNWNAAMPPCDQLLEAALNEYRKQEILLNEDGAYAAMTDIFLARYPVLVDAVRHDVLEAALLREMRWEVTLPRQVKLRIGILSALVEDANLVQTATRPMNIVAAAKKKGLEYAWEDPLGKIEPDKLDSAEGVQLLMVLKQQEETLFKAAHSEDSATIKALIGALVEPINRFFGNTMVMAEDESVRYQRLSLCHAASLQLLAAGDFTKLLGV